MSGAARWTFIVIPAIAVALVACEPVLPDGRLACTTRDECPSGWACVASRCFREAPDAATPGEDAGGRDGGSTDAGPDAGPGDAGPSDAGPTDGGGPTVLFEQISVGFDHVCARTSERTVYCWGNNDTGELGDGTTTSRPTPTPVPGLEDVTFVSAGAHGTCARTQGGELHCWGSGAEGGNGDGSTGDLTSPTLISLPAPCTFMQRGWSHSCAQTASGFYCWGTHRFLGLQDRTEPALTPVEMTLPAGALGPFAVLGSTYVFVDDTLYAWGFNGGGHLGDGTTDNSTTPVAVSGITTRGLVRAGATNACLLTDGTVRCWGRNDNGQVGNGTTVGPVTTPEPTMLSSTATGLDFGFAHGCAILDDQTVECWGRNEFGEVGDGTTVSRPTPRPVGGLTGVQRISTGESTTCALVGVLPTDEVYCWGRNGSGQLGDGTTTDSSVPVRVVF